MNPMRCAALVVPSRPQLASATQRLHRTGWGVRSLVRHHGCRKAGRTDHVARTQWRFVDRNEVSPGERRSPSTAPPRAWPTLGMLLLLRAPPPIGVDTRAYCREPTRDRSSMPRAALTYSSSAHPSSKWNIWTTALHNALLAIDGHTNPLSSERFRGCASVDKMCSSHCPPPADLSVGQTKGWRWSPDIVQAGVTACRAPCVDRRPRLALDRPRHCQGCDLPCRLGPCTRGEGGEGGEAGEGCRNGFGLFSQIARGLMRALKHPFYECPPSKVVHAQGSSICL